jgi:hypothetical protein
MKKILITLISFIFISTLLLTLSSCGDLFQSPPDPPRIRPVRTTVIVQDYHGKRIPNRTVYLEINRSTDIVIKDSLKTDSLGRAILNYSQNLDQDFSPDKVLIYTERDKNLIPLNGLSNMHSIPITDLIIRMDSTRLFTVRIHKKGSAKGKIIVYSWDLDKYKLFPGLYKENVTSFDTTFKILAFRNLVFDVGGTFRQEDGTVERVGEVLNAQYKGSNIYLPFTK